MDSLQNIPLEKTYNLTHYVQQHNWDCGLSCIIMILGSSQRSMFLKNFETIRSEEEFGSSTWTIDLSYLLRRFNIRHDYYTKTIGIDPQYMAYAYYSKIIEKDRKRVVRKFKEAKDRGLHVEKRTLEMQSLIKHLGNHGPVILLTNAAHLICNICKNAGSSNAGRYSGHYVVLCGYNLHSKLVFYHNPEVRDGHVCLCTIFDMDIARKSFGTDEDILLIYKN